MSVITGRLYDGQVSRRQPAELHHWPDGRLEIRSGSQRLRVVLGQVRVSSRLGNTPRRLALPDDSLFETDDNDAVDRLLGSGSTHRGPLFLHRLESRLAMLLPVLALALLMGWWLLAYGVPILSRHTAEALPSGMLDEASRQSMLFLDEYVFEPSELPEAWLADLRRAFADMAISNPEYRFELSFRKGGDVLGANAFALPSGHIVVTDELLALAETDEEVLAVLAHEMGHVVHRHGLRQVLQGSLLTLGVFLISGDPDSLVSAVPAAMVGLSYSRDFERQADEYAGMRLRKAGLSPALLADMLERLEREQTEDHSGDDHGMSHFLATHPATAERAADLRR